MFSKTISNLPLEDSVVRLQCSRDEPIAIVAGRRRDVMMSMCWLIRSLCDDIYIKFISERGCALKTVVGEDNINSNMLDFLLGNTNEMPGSVVVLDLTGGDDEIAIAELVGLAEEHQIFLIVLVSKLQDLSKSWHSADVESISFCLLGRFAGGEQIPQFSRFQAMIDFDYTTASSCFKLCVPAKDWGWPVLTGANEKLLRQKQSTPQITPSP